MEAIYDTDNSILPEQKVIKKKKNQKTGPSNWKTKILDLPQTMKKLAASPNTNHKPAKSNTKGSSLSKRFYLRFASCRTSSLNWTYTSML